MPATPAVANMRLSPKYKPYTFSTYAQGGITDLDNYDAAPQPTKPDPYTIDVPNRNEVMDNQGYVSDAVQTYAQGGISSLGSYSDGGQLLKGPGDGISDDIPADRKSTRLNSSHTDISRMPSSA